MRLFLAGFAAGIAATLWLIARSMSTAEDQRQALIDQEWNVPVDPYSSGLVQ